MGETSDEIMQQIEQTRAALGANLQALEHKVRQTTDWRQHFRKNPLPLLGLAFAAGLLLAMVGMPARVPR